MDPAGVAESEANIDQEILRPESGHGKRSAQPSAKTAALVGAGGIDLEREPSESTPLLGGADASTLPDESDQDGTGDKWPGLEDFKGLPWWRRPSIWLILPPFFIFMLAFGGTVVPKINLVQDLICRDYYAKQALLNPQSAKDIWMALKKDKDMCTIPAVERATSDFTMAQSLITGILSAITSPKLGALSDRYGRLRILVLSSAGLLLNEVATIFAATYPESFSVNWILLGYAVDGLGGSFITGMAVSSSYAADCTHPSRRNVVFGYLHGAMFTGVALGPLLVAGIIRLFNARLLTLFYIALGCHILFMLSLFFVVPESLSKRRRMAAQKRHDAIHAGVSISKWQQAKELITTMFEPLKILFPTGPGSSTLLRRNLVVIAAIDTIVFGVAMGALSVVVIYMRKQFSWDPADQSIFVSLVNSSRVVCLFVVLPIVVRLVRGPASRVISAAQQHGADRLDLSIIRFGIIVDTIGYIGYSLALSPELFTLAGMVASVGSLASPTLQSVMTKSVPHGRIGELLGASGLLHALARCVSPIVFNLIFRSTLDTFRQAVFVSLAATFGLGSIMSWLLRPNVYLREDAEAEGSAGPVVDAAQEPDIIR